VQGLEKKNVPQSFMPRALDSLTDTLKKKGKNDQTVGTLRVTDRKESKKDARVPLLGGLREPF